MKEGWKVAAVDDYKQGNERQLTTIGVGAREESKTNTGIDGLTDSEGRRQNGGGNGRGAKGEGERNGSVKDNGGRTDNKRSGRIGEGWHLRGPIDSGGGFNSKNKNGGRTRRGRLP